MDLSDIPILHVNASVTLNQRVTLPIDASDQARSLRPAGLPSELCDTATDTRSGVNAVIVEVENPSAVAFNVAVLVGESGSADHIEFVYEGGPPTTITGLLDCFLAADICQEPMFDDDVEACVGYPLPAGGKVWVLVADYQANQAASSFDFIVQRYLPQ